MNYQVRTSLIPTTHTSGKKHFKGLRSRWFGNSPPSRNIQPGFYFIFSRILEKSNSLNYMKTKIVRNYWIKRYSRVTFFYVIITITLEIYFMKDFWCLAQYLYFWFVGSHHGLVQSYFFKCYQQKKARRVRDSNLASLTSTSSLPHLPH